MDEEEEKEGNENCHIFLESQAKEYFNEDDDEDNNKDENSDDNKFFF